MPRLKGKSSQGSKPITSPPRTLSWIPHCWPQKQQWVFTRRSGSSDDVARRFADRCGPKVWMMSMSLVGRVAMLFLRGRRDRLAPQRALGQSEQGPPAAGADLLVVAVSIGQLVAEAQLAFDASQVPDGRGRCVRRCATT